MGLSGELAKRREANARAIAGFGVKLPAPGIRTIRDGGTVTIFTIGYEKRDAEALIAILRDQGVEAVADVRERPISRKPEFRAPALRALCESAGIEYQPWPSLGSTVEQREELHASGDFRAFERQFRAVAEREMQPDLERLARSAAAKRTALLCYERMHEDCHRSIIAEMVALKVNATVLAL